MSQTCPYCRESISESDLAECPACHTPHHHDCWVENGGCTVFGCERAPTDDPKIAVYSHEIAGAPEAPSYFVSRNGQQYGPYTLDALRQESYRRTVVRDDLVWTEGLANWVSLSQILSTPQLPTQVASLRTPYTESNDPSAGRTRFGRGLYFLSLLTGGGVMGALSNSRDTEAIGALIFWCVWIPVAVLRARDVGMSGWSVLLFFVPIANLFVGFRLLFAPRGYAITKKADTVIRVMTWVFLGFLGLFIISILIIVANQ